MVSYCWVRYNRIGRMAGLGTGPHLGREGDGLARRLSDIKGEFGSVVGKLLINGYLRARRGGNEIHLQTVQFQSAYLGEGRPISIRLQIESFRPDAVRGTGRFPLASRGLKMVWAASQTLRGPSSCSVQKGKNGHGCRESHGEAILIEDFEDFRPRETLSADQRSRSCF